MQLPTRAVHILDALFLKEKCGVPSNCSAYKPLEQKEHKSLMILIAQMKMKTVLVGRLLESVKEILSL